MNRLRPPEPDRWYLDAIELVKHHVDTIERALRLRTEDPDPSAFAACIPSAEALLKTLSTAAESAKIRQR